MKYKLSKFHRSLAEIEVVPNKQLTRIEKE
jgi:hypothetical protein